MSDSLRHIDLQGIVIADAVRLLIAGIRQTGVRPGRLWRKVRLAIDDGGNGSVRIGGGEEVIATLSHVTDGKEGVVGHGLVHSQAVLEDSRPFQVRLDAGRANLGSREALSGRKKDRKSRRGYCHSVVVSADRNGVATSAHIVQLLIIHAVSGVDRGVRTGEW